MPVLKKQKNRMSAKPKPETGHLKQIQRDQEDTAVFQSSRYHPLDATEVNFPIRAAHHNRH